MAETGPAEPVREVADELYGLPLRDFTKARDDHARRLRKEGRREVADAVKALRKPTLPAWALNQLARRRPAPGGQAARVDARVDGRASARSNRRRRGRRTAPSAGAGTESGASRRAKSATRSRRRAEGNRASGEASRRDPGKGRGRQGRL